MLPRYKLLSLPLIFLQFIFDFYSAYCAVSEASILPSTLWLSAVMMIGAIVLSEIALVKTFIMDAGCVTTTMIETFKTSLLSKN